MASLMNNIRYDLVSLNIAELNDDSLEEFLATINFTAIATTDRPILPFQSNFRQYLLTWQSLIDNVKDYFIITIQSERVAFVNYYTPREIQCGIVIVHLKKNDLYAGNINITNNLETLQNTVSLLLDMGINKIIAIGNSGDIKYVETIVNKIYGIDIFSK